ncbi:FliA/WhiG family RNA polymerase sigma factor [Salmonella enterica]|nr:FliA/WhiG family RNA polymerase sigma factor [Salmonella enterica]
MNSLYTAEGVMDKHSLWQRYVPLVRHEALRLQVRLPASVELDDLLQAGGIGLLNAVDRYDALQGTAFTTYAVQRIRGAMLDELRSRDWVPRSVRRNAREVAQAMGQLEQELGRNATETEVAERLGIPVAEYRQMLLDTNNSQLFSYDEWREEHGDSIELVTEEHQQENPLHQLLEGDLRQRVMDAIESLPEREQLVLILFFEPEGEGFSLPPDSPALHVIQHIRDESHDHAIGGHRKKRAKVKNTSTLETIEGVGPKRRQMLLKYMGGLQGLRNASVEEIAKVPGISQGLAEKIFWSLKH